MPDVAAKGFGRSALLDAAGADGAERMALRSNSSMSTGPAEVVTTKSVSSCWAEASNDQQCGMYDDNDDFAADYAAKSFGYIASLDAAAAEGDTRTEIRCDVASRSCLAPPPPHGPEENATQTLILLLILSSGAVKQRRASLAHCSGCHSCSVSPFRAAAKCPAKVTKCPTMTPTTASRKVTSASKLPSRPRR